MHRLHSNSFLDLATFLSAPPSMDDDNAEELENNDRGTDDLVDFVLAIIVSPVVKIRPHIAEYPH